MLEIVNIKVLCIIQLIKGLQLLQIQHMIQVFHRQDVLRIVKPLQLAMFVQPQVKLQDHALTLVEMTYMKVFSIHSD